MVNAKHTILLVAGLLAFSTVSAEMPVWTGVVTTSTPIVTASTGALTTSLKISSVDTIDKTTLSVKFEWAVAWGLSPQSEVKVLKDTLVASSEKDAKDWKIFNVKLSEDLSLSWASYSLLSLSDLDLNADFTINWAWTKIDNTKAWAELTWKTIEVVDSKTLKITFTKDLWTTVPSFKLLKETKVESVFFDTTNLNVKLADWVTKDSAYILMALSLKDNSWKEIEVENSLFDFKTPATIVWDEVLASSWALSSTGETLTASGGSWADIASVAMAATTTPDTWTKENLIIFLSLLLAASVFVFRKKSLKI